MGTELWNVAIRVIRELDGKAQGAQTAQTAQVGGRVLKGMLSFTKGPARHTPFCASLHRNCITS
jgi:hypothetical protein